MCYPPAPHVKVVMIFLISKSEKTGFYSVYLTAEDIGLELNEAIYAPQRLIFFVRIKSIILKSE